MDCCKVMTTENKINTFSILKLISLQQNTFFEGTQAFANPTDLASSGVWEDVFLCKTPTFDGACGIIFFIILLTHLYAKLCQLVGIVINVYNNGRWYCQLFLVGCDRCYCHRNGTTKMLEWQMFLPMWVPMANFLRWLMVLPLWQME